MPVPCPTDCVSGQAGIPALGTNSRISFDSGIFYLGMVLMNYLRPLISKNKPGEMTERIIKLFLRLAISLSFMSAVADRFGLWGTEYSVWGNWENFLAYTKLINPWLPEGLILAAGIFATGAEIILAFCLLAGFRTELAAKLCGFLLLLFALSMTLSTGIKGALDYSVFTASAGAFALASCKNKFLELDSLISR